MKKKSLLLGVLMAVALLASTAIGATVAMMKAETAELTNSFELGSVKTEILEGQDGFKNPMITNLGENECLVRARVLISPAEAANNVVLEGGMGWTLANDGYYYYNNSLVPEATTEAIFKTIKIKDGVDWSSLGIKDFEVTVYQEAVQSVVYVNGEAETDPKKIWEIYEVESAQSSGQN